MSKASMFITYLFCTWQIQSEVFHLILFNLPNSFIFSERKQARQGSACPDLAGRNLSSYLMSLSHMSTSLLHHTSFQNPSTVQWTLHSSHILVSRCCLKNLNTFSLSNTLLLIYESLCHSVSSKHMTNGCVSSVLHLSKAQIVMHPVRRYWKEQALTSDRNAVLVGVYVI